ncbi:hypothetical protein [Ilumatobacter nonamiensis]|uniref:hypothetical protein n=1 Tax=Ilumatobacter nonamiensis TaxID=467093 RepID=UPI0011D26546|nr:hypothetical protein [Ilumatobacter nonamiensis]
MKSGTYVDDRAPSGELAASKAATKRTRRGLSWLLAAGLAIATLGGGSASPAEARGGGGWSDLFAAWLSSAKYHSVERAERAGYQLGWKNPDIPISGCIEHPTDGAMGYHWFDHDAIEDTVLDPLRPEGLVYEPLPNGKLRLVALEWVVPAELWHAEHDEPPTVLGQEMGILNPALGWYILHAWVWKWNPSGTFNNWNPRVICP